MLYDALFAIAVAGPAVAAIIAVGLAGWALSGLRRADVRLRVRLVPLLTGAAAAFVLVGGAFELLGGWFLAYGVFTDATRPQLGKVMASIAPVAGAVGLVAASSSAFGYIAFARLGPPRSPAAGSALGPVLALALTIAGATAYQVASGAESAALMQAQQQDLENRSASVHLTVADVQASIGEGGSVITGVHMHVSLQSDADLGLGSGGKLANPRFVLTSPSGQSFEPTSSISATLLPSRVQVPFDLVFDTTTASAPSQVRLVSTYQGPPGPGTWRLRVDMEDRAGLLFTVSTDVRVTLDAPAPS